jgi:ubiquitin thioesterase OTU1
MRMRLRAPGGQSTITLSNDATINDLIAQITEKTSISSFDVKYGYPPKPLLLEQCERSLPLSQLDVKLDGEQLTISAREDSDSGAGESKVTGQKSSQDEGLFSFTDGASTSTPQKLPKPIALKKKGMAGEVPEIPMPARGATLGAFLECYIFVSSTNLSFSSTSYAR